jgi:hypothetical protein
MGGKISRARFLDVGAAVERIIGHRDVERRGFRSGDASAVARKTRPRSGLQAPDYILGTVSCIPPLPYPRFAGPLGLSSGKPWYCGFSAS